MLSMEAKLVEKTFAVTAPTKPQARALASIAEEFSMGEFCSAAGLHRESAEPLSEQSANGRNPLFKRGFTHQIFKLVDR